MKSCSSPPTPIPSFLSSFPSFKFLQSLWVQKSMVFDRRLVASLKYCITNAWTNTHVIAYAGYTIGSAGEGLLDSVPSVSPYIGTYCIHLKYN